MEVDLKPALAKIERPSSVVSTSGMRGIDGWKQSLSASQVAQILQTVHALGLSFYTTEPEADDGKLHSQSLAEEILTRGLS